MTNNNNNNEGNTMNDLQRVARIASTIVFKQHVNDGEVNIEAAIWAAFSRCWSVENNKENQDIVLDMMH